MATEKGELAMKIATKLLWSVGALTLLTACNNAKPPEGAATPAVEAIAPAEVPPATNEVTSDPTTNGVGGNTVTDERGLPDRR